MGKNVLIVGKNASAVSDLAETMSAGGFSVAAADAESGQTSSLGGVSVVSWNKGSAVSARSLIIQAETALGYLDDYILYFIIYHSIAIVSCFCYFAFFYCVFNCTIFFFFM